MGNGMILIIIIGLVVGAYFFVPAFQEQVNPYLNKGKNVVSNTNGSYTLGEIYYDIVNDNSTNSTNTTYVTDPKVYSELGYPSKDTTYDCQYDRDCELFYDELCSGKTCVCLPNGKCAIKVV